MASQRDTVWRCILHFRSAAPIDFEICQSSYESVRICCEHALANNARGRPIHMMFRSPEHRIKIWSEGLIGYQFVRAGYVNYETHRASCVNSKCDRFLRPVVISPESDVCSSCLQHTHMVDVRHFPMENLSDADQEKLTLGRLNR